MAYDNESDAESEADDAPINYLEFNSNESMESRLKNETDDASEKHIRSSTEALVVNSNDTTNASPPTCMASDLAELLRADEKMSDTHEDTCQHEAARQHDQSVKWIHHIVDMHGCHFLTSEFANNGVQEVCWETDSDSANNKCEVGDSGSDDEAHTMTIRHSSCTEALLIMCTTTLKDTFNMKFLEFFDATYVMKISYYCAPFLEITIPTTIASALTDEFAYQWLMAIQNELQLKFINGYEFETVIKMVMGGAWLFETKASTEIHAAIDFKATRTDVASTESKTVIYEYTNNGMVAL